MTMSLSHLLMCNEKQHKHSTVLKTKCKCYQLSCQAILILCRPWNKASFASFSTLSQLLVNMSLITKSAAPAPNFLKTQVCTWMLISKRGYL